ARAQQRFAHQAAVDEVIVLVPVLLAARPAVEQQHQPPGPLVCAREFDIAGHEESLRAPEHKLLPQPARLFPIPHDPPLQRNALVVVKERQPRLEGLLADAWIGVRLLGPGRQGRSDNQAGEDQAGYKPAGVGAGRYGNKDWRKDIAHGRNDNEAVTWTQRNLVPGLAGPHGSHQPPAKPAALNGEWLKTIRPQAFAGRLS